jgi:hypothetical protein
MKCSGSNPAEPNPMSAILKSLQAIFTKLPENLPAQYSESNYYRFLVTANYG